MSIKPSEDEARGVFEKHACGRGAAGGAGVLHPRGGVLRVETFVDRLLGAGTPASRPEGRSQVQRGPLGKEAGPFYRCTDFVLYSSSCCSCDV